MSSAERLIYIVRHGATDWNQSGRIQGHIDIPLNETGRAQARMVSRRLAAFGATALCSSDLLRAYETAQIIGQTTGLRVLQEPELREINGGVCTALGLRALGFDCTGKRTFDSHNCGIHTIAVQGDTWRAIAMNDITHLTAGC